MQKSIKRQNKRANKTKQILVYQQWIGSNKNIQILHIFKDLIFRRMWRISNKDVTATACIYIRNSSNITNNLSFHCWTAVKQILNVVSTKWYFFVWYFFVERYVQDVRLRCTSEESPNTINIAENTVLSYFLTVVKSECCFHWVLLYFLDACDEKRPWIQ